MNNEKIQQNTADVEVANKTLVSTELEQGNDSTMHENDLTSANKTLAATELAQSNDRPLQENDLTSANKTLVSAELAQRNDSPFQENDLTSANKTLAATELAQGNDSPLQENSLTSESEQTAQAENTSTAKAEKHGRQKRANTNTANAPSKTERRLEKRMQRQARSEQKRKQLDEQLPQEVRLQRKLDAIASLQQSNKRWYRLDNAALMYPLVARGESISVFRVSALLKEPVDPVELQYAVNDIAPRFPTLCGSVKNGLFWPYIERPTIPVIVKPQSKVPGRPMKVDGKHSQMRINYFGNEISVEFFHSATDGTGGIIFLNSLLRRYFQRIGKAVDDQTNCFDYRDVPTLDEIRDNFANIAVRKNPPPCPKAIKVSKINGTPQKNKKYVTVRGVCSAAQLKEAAHRHNATITQFLGALQLLALDRLSNVTSSTQKKPIRVMIPVNLRKIFGVETIRNFSSYIFYQYNGQTDIDEIIADIRNQEKQQLTEDYFRGMVSFNYNNGNLPILKIAPLALKRAVMSAIVSNQGDGKVNNSTLSNLGKISAPKEFDELVLRYDFMLGKPARNTNNFTAVTFNDICVIAVTNPFLERDCERLFFRELAKAGVDVAVESDIWEEAE